MSLPATVSEIFGGQTTASILVVTYRCSSLDIMVLENIIKRFLALCFWVHVVLVLILTQQKPTL